MMPSFDGVSGAKRKVDLRGRSAGAAPQSKEALLAEARREREARAAHKARTAGATALQVRASRTLCARALRTRAFRLRQRVAACGR